MKVEIDLWLQDALVEFLCELVSRDLKKKFERYNEGHGEYTDDHYIRTELKEVAHGWIEISWEVTRKQPYQSVESGTEMYEIRDALRMFIA